MIFTCRCRAYREAALRATAKNTRTTPTAIGPQNGSRTHSQDQAITPVSFRVTKIRPSTEQIPIFIITSMLFSTTNPTTIVVEQHRN